VKVSENTQNKAEEDQLSASIQIDGTTKRNGFQPSGNSGSRPGFQKSHREGMEVGKNHQRRWRKTRKREGEKEQGWKASDQTWEFPLVRGIQRLEEA
jgi:hypothetical protein